jgi:hypothetical protein
VVAWEPWSPGQELALTTSFEINSIIIIRILRPGREREGEKERESTVFI